MFREKRYAEAEPFFRDAVRLDPSEQNESGLAVDLFNEAKFTKKPNHACGKLVALKPESALYQNSLGNGLALQQRYAEAEQYYRQAVRLRSEQRQVCGQRRRVAILSRQVRGRQALL